MQTHDPIYALIESRRKAEHNLKPFTKMVDPDLEPGYFATSDALHAANLKLVSSPPSTWEGFQALLAYWRESDLKHVGEYAIRMVETLTQSFERLKDAKH